MKIITLDLEEWFHILEHESVEDSGKWSSFDNRLDAVVDDLLCILSKFSVRPTIFALGWIARKRPDVIKRLAEYGCEIGSHSDLHALATRLSQSEFRNDLTRSIKSIEDLTGRKVISYRAPGFSITLDNLWVFEELIAQGIQYDASIFSARRAHGGLRSSNIVGPTVLKTQAGDIREFPMSFLQLGPIRVPCSGGGYFRLFPWPLLDAILRQQHYVMSYFHPRDFDPGQPVVNGLGGFRRFKSYYGIKNSSKKLHKMLVNTAFFSLSEAASLVDWENAPEVNL